MITVQHYGSSDRSSRYTASGQKFCKNTHLPGNVDESEYGNEARGQKWQFPTNNSGVYPTAQILFASIKLMEEQRSPNTPPKNQYKNIVIANRGVAPPEIQP